MTDQSAATFRAQLEEFIGKPMGAGRSNAPDPVNIPMIRHWVDALADQNPLYLQADAVAPPAMLQTWTMGRPTIEGIAERGGAPGSTGRSVLTALDEAGYTATRATNSELEFERYLHPGEQLESSSLLESISEEKTTALGKRSYGVCSLCQSHSP